MRSIFAIIALLLGLITMTACTHTVVYYGYKPTSYMTDEKLEIFFTMMHSADDSAKGSTVYGEPYTLVVDTFSNENIRSLSFQNIVMKRKSGSNELSLGDKSITPPLCVNDAECSATITFELERLDYGSYALSGLVVLNNRPQKFIVELETDFKKDRINKFWEVLMGI